MASDLKSGYKISGHIDCGPSAEDEEECALTEEMVKKLREDCEADTNPKHILCPNSHVCIKQEWLCDGGEENLRKTF